MGIGIGICMYIHMRMYVYIYMYMYAHIYFIAEACPASLDSDPVGPGVKMRYTDG